MNVISERTGLPADCPVEPLLRKYLRPSQVEEVYAIKPWLLNRLIQQGSVRCVVIGDEGKSRGVKLVSIESLDKFFRGEANPEEAKFGFDEFFSSIFATKEEA